jgi:hypothetical protein
MLANNACDAFAAVLVSLAPSFAEPLWDKAGGQYVESGADHFDPGVQESGYQSRSRRDALSSTSRSIEPSTFYLLNSTPLCGLWWDRLLRLH